MHSTWEMTTGSGQTLRFEGRYTCEMMPTTLDADGWEIKTDPKPTVTEHELVAYLDGKKVDSCWQEDGWHTIDFSGSRKIWGMKIVFRDPEKAAEYDRWIDELLAGGECEDVRRYRAAEKQRQLGERKESLLKEIARMEKQKDLPSAAEAKRRMRVYNEVHNEGGYGFVPHIYSREEYDRAIAELEKIDAEMKGAENK